MKDGADLAHFMSESNLYNTYMPYLEGTFMWHTVSGCVFLKFFACIYFLTPICFFSTTPTSNSFKYSSPPSLSFSHSSISSWTCTPWSKASNSLLLFSSSSCFSWFLPQNYLPLSWQPNKVITTHFRPSPPSNLIKI